MSIDSKHRDPEDDDPIETANDMLRKEPNRTISPSADAMEGAPGRPDLEPLDGQLGPDEISDPDELVKNQEAKHHH